MYIINEVIPGWTSVSKLNDLAEMAANVKEDGLVVEVGSFCGRSAYALGMNKKASVKLLCVDMFVEHWVYDVKVKDYPSGAGCFGDTMSRYSYPSFMENVKDVVNLETARMTLPYNANFFKFTGKIDLLFIDCQHTYEAVNQDIAQWCGHMAEGGVIIFDDYDENFEGCVRAVNEYAKLSNKTLSTSTDSYAQSIAIVQ